MKYWQGMNYLSNIQLMLRIIDENFPKYLSQKMIGRYAKSLVKF